MTMSKKEQLLNEWERRLGIITRKDAKAFYDSLGGASAHYTGMQVARILRSAGFCPAQINCGHQNRFIDVWVLKSLWTSVVPNV